MIQCLLCGVSRFFRITARDASAFAVASASPRSAADVSSQAHTIHSPSFLLVVTSRSSSVIIVMSALVSAPWDTKAGWDGPNKSAEVRAALEDGSADVHASGEDGRTLLMNAAAFCVDPDCIAMVLSKGAVATVVDASGKTALHHLCANNTNKIAASYATALLGAGADPRVKDGAGITALEMGRKRKNSAVLPVLESWQPPPPAVETLAAIRTNGWFEPWAKQTFAAIDKAFDADASLVEMVSLVGADDEISAHQECAALTADLEAAYKGGSMGGGSLRQVTHVRIEHSKIVSKLSKLDDDLHVIVVFCAPSKRDGVSKKIAKYNEKLGSERITTTWAAKEAYPIE